jgi:tRNA (cmo5U34)-methyltransferase
MTDPDYEIKVPTYDPAADKWTFDQAVTDVFDDMLARSIPQYGVMRQAVVDVLYTLLPRNAETKRFLDLGTSRGDTIARLEDRFGAKGRYLGIEISGPMVAAATERFADNDRVTIHKMDLRHAFPDDWPADAVLAVLTLMFIPIEYRQGILRRTYETLPEGGVFIMVEKVLGDGALLQDAFVDIYHHMKGDNGYSLGEIDRKALALEGVLVPLPAETNEQLLRQAGFRHVDVFWRWMNFTAWVAVK